MVYLWKCIGRAINEAYKNAFFSSPFRIIGKTTDNLTKRVVFSIKAKRVLSELKLSTGAIIKSEHYLSGLSAKDREQIIEQYLLEIKQPLAYIEEFPVEANSNNEYIFKVFLLNEKKFICGSASYFIKQNKEVLSLLSSSDLIKISHAYYKERYEILESIYQFNNTKPNNLHRLK